VAIGTRCRFDAPKNRRKALRCEKLADRGDTDHGFFALMDQGPIALPKAHRKSGCGCRESVYSPSPSDHQRVGGGHLTPPRLFRIGPSLQPAIFSVKCDCSVTGGLSTADKNIYRCGRVTSTSRHPLHKGAITGLYPDTVLERTVHRIRLGAVGAIYHIILAYCDYLLIATVILGVWLVVGWLVTCKDRLRNRV
jgi:hypothetical protein